MKYGDFSDVDRVNESSPPSDHSPPVGYDSSDSDSSDPDISDSDASDSDSPDFGSFEGPMMAECVDISGFNAGDFDTDEDADAFYAEGLDAYGLDTDASTNGDASGSDGSDSGALEPNPSDEREE